MADPYAMKLPASFTIEASMVMAVVFFTLGMVIRNAYVVYDQVTGAMILEETVEAVRWEDSKEEREAAVQRGEALGNPRLWLGEYDLTVESRGNRIQGRAKAGEWKYLKEKALFQPGDFLRKADAAARLIERTENR